jgi:hypothetical protein
MVNSLLFQAASSCSSYSTIDTRIRVNLAPTNQSPRVEFTLLRTSIEPNR